GRLMKILLNFVPLKSGGGVQVALDFIAQAKKFGKHHEWHLVATSGTPLARVEETDNFRMEKVVPRSLWARLWFEDVGWRALLERLKVSVGYTQFGPQWPGASRVRNVVGCAYSNLLYPEVDFWAALPPVRRTIRKFVDIFRRGRLYSADLVIFETDD